MRSVAGILSCGFLVSSKQIGSGIEVNDCHVHSIKDGSQVQYGYDGFNGGGPWFALNYTFKEYQRAVAGTVLEPDSHMFMSLYNTRADQYVPQAQLAYGLSHRIQQENLSPAMSGIVANVNFSLGADVSSYMDQMMEAVPAVRGFRAYYAAEGPFSDAFLEGAREAERRSLTVECLQPSLAQLAELYRLAVSIPGTRFVINHMGLKGIPDEAGGELPDFAWWRGEMEKLAALPNVYVKISGGAAPRGANAVDAMRPFVHHLVRSFGYRRTIFAGNWFAVDGSFGFFSYSKWADAVQLYLTELEATREDTEWMLHRACETAYRLESAPLTSAVV